MGIIYDCNCNECKHEFKIYDGEGRASISLICANCGKGSGIPRRAPRPDRNGREVSPVLTTTTYYSTPPIAADQIKRFTKDELMHIDPLKSDGDDWWDDFEIEALIESKNPCACGGVVQKDSITAETGRPNSLRRCPNCKSFNFKFGHIGAWS